MNKAIPALAVIIVLAGLCWLFPPFHLRSVKQVKAEIADAKFNAADFVKPFWSEKLLPSADQAVDAEKVLAVIATNPQKVREQFGRTLGISSSYCLYLRGSGRVVSVSDDSIGLSLKNDGDVVDISVPLGLVFGNAVRDGTGLINPSTYPNAQDFNDISAGLNLIVETRVLPELQKIAKVGTKVRFVGCAEVADEDSDLKPLKLSPISVKLD